MINKITPKKKYIQGLVTPPPLKKESLSTMKTFFSLCTWWLLHMYQVRVLHLADSRKCIGNYIVLAFDMFDVQVVLLHS